MKISLSKQTWRISAWLAGLAVLFLLTSCNSQEADLTAPSLTNNPTWDIIATNRQPYCLFLTLKAG